MSIELAEQIRERGLAALDFLIYPRVLERGLLDGINASEFPVLNVLGLPGFLISPWVGVFFTASLLLLLNLYAAYACLPKLLRAWGVEVDGFVCLLLWFAGGTLASQANTIMPEGLAFPLVVAGIVQLLEAGNNLRRFSLAILLCTLGIAAKPTVVITLGAAAALPLLVDRHRPQWKWVFAGCFLSVLFPGWWYGVHAKHILSFAQGPQVFALADFNPILKLKQVGWDGLYSMLRREPYQGQLPMFVGWFFIAAGLVLGEWIPVVLYLLSLVAATSLDGPHIYVHGYYFIGTCVFSIILMARVLGAVQSRRFLATLTIVLIAWGVLFNVRGNVWIWARDSQYWKVNLWAMGAEARKVVGSEYHLIADDGPYPLKLLFIGRSGTDAGAQVYQACNRPQYVGRPLALISDSPPPAGAALCGGRSQETKIAETSFGEWYVTLVH
jgi:hypothetical protein